MVTLCNATGLFLAIIGLKHYHLKSEKYTYRLRAFGQSCWRRIKAAIQIFERLQTTTYIKFDLLENRSPSQITYWKNSDCVCPWGTVEYATNTDKKYCYTFRINQITFTYGERKKQRPNFYGMVGQNLPIFAAFTAILKISRPQCNVVGVRTPPESA